MMSSAVVFAKLYNYVGYHSSFVKHCFMCLLSLNVLQNMVIYFLNLQKLHCFVKSLRKLVDFPSCLQNVSEEDKKGKYPKNTLNNLPQPGRIESSLCFIP